MYLIITLISVAFILFLYNQKIKLRRMEILTENIPGPKSYPFIGSVLSIRKNEETLTKMCRMAKTYGSIFKVWIGPSLFIFLHSPEDIREILSNRKLVNKPFIVKFVEPAVGSKSLFTAKDEQWRKRRKLIMPSFRFKMIEQSFPCLNSNCKLLVANLQNEVGKPGFNVNRYLDLCTMDIISETAFGEKFDAQRRNSLILAKLIHEVEYLIVYRSKRLWAYWDILFYLSSAGKRQRKMIKQFYDILRQVLDTKRKHRLEEKEFIGRNQQRQRNSIGEKKPQSLIDDLLDCNENGTEQLTDEDIMKEMAVIIVAGQSSTASAISFIMHALRNNQDIQDKMVDELNCIFKGSDRDITLNDVQNMHYIEKVIKETLRLWPPASYVLRNISKDIVLESGYTLPAGSSVLLFFYELHRNPDIFPNPDIFDPERFNSENTQGRHQYSYCPFSAGPRNCIGEKYAFVKLKVMVAYILRKYKILTPTIKCPDVLLSSDIVLHSKTGIHIRIENR